MSYTIAPSPNGRYIVITVLADIDRKLAMKFVVEAHALGRQLGIRRYLVDVVQARNVDPVIDQYEFAYTDIQQVAGIDRDARVAAVAAPGDTSHDFIEIVARNAGFSFRLFFDPREAEAFLMTD